MSAVALVTGANGHLGANLVRYLIARGDEVIATVRDPATANDLRTLGARVATLDLRDADAAKRAFVGARVVYHCAAVFSHWARNAEQTIYQANLTITRNVIEAAARAAVGRVVYVSSLGALDRSRSPFDESSWNPNRTNVYFRSKTDSERLAWALADARCVPLVSVLPAAMIGPHCTRPTPTMALLGEILARRMRLDPGLHFTLADVRDVAVACRAAATRGRPGERYLLACETSLSVSQMVEIARTCLPALRIPRPIAAPRRLMPSLAGAMEVVAMLTGGEPSLQRSFFTEFSAPERCDIRKARAELGFAPAPAAKLLSDYLTDFAPGGTAPRPL